MVTCSILRLQDFDSPKASCFSAADNLCRFRWVECQLDSLKRCLHSERHLNRCLASLPRTLDETYERMLCNIEEEYTEEARRLLTLVIFSPKRLSVEEVIDGIAVDLEQPSRLDPERRLQGVEDLQMICPGLITFITNPSFTVVQIAHFSVQEYLESDRIKSSKASKYALSSDAAHDEIARVFLTYLMDLDFDEYREVELLSSDYPLIWEAVLHWSDHCKQSVERSAHLGKLLKQFFIENPRSFSMWEAWYWELYHQTGRPYPFLHKSEKSPLDYAILFSLDDLTEQLIQRMADPRQGQIAPQNQDHLEQSALLEAANANNRFAMKKLLEAGFDVNTECLTSRINPLQVACLRGWEDMVNTLVKKGADINAVASNYSPVLVANIATDNPPYPGRTQRWAGADINDLDGRVPALCIAATKGHKGVVKLLLEAGADTDCKDIQDTTALQSACVHGHLEIVRMLIAAGADVNAPGGGYHGHALHAAACGNIKIVQTLLEAGADANAGSRSHTPLVRASSVGNTVVVQALLAAGADIAATDDNFATALQYACVLGYKTTAETLLTGGAEVNDSEGIFAPALKAACFNLYPDVIRMLLDRDTDDMIDAQKPLWRPDVTS